MRRTLLKSDENMHVVTRTHIRELDVCLESESVKQNRPRQILRGSIAAATRKNETLLLHTRLPSRLTRDFFRLSCWFRESDSTIVVFMACRLI